MESHTGEHVDMERERLLSILSLAFDGPHYHPECNCETCEDTRGALEPEDLEFIDQVAASTEGKVVRDTV